MKSTEELALIASIADELPAGVWVATVPEGRFVYSNRAFEEVMGMGPVSGLGVGRYSQPYGIFTRDGRPYPEDRLPFVLAVQARATVIVDDIVIHRRDGRRVFVRAFGKPMFDARGQMTHVAIAFFDITREAEAQSKLAQGERLATIGLLAASVGHEINNPLSYLLASLELISREIGEAGRGAHDATLRTIDEHVRDARQGAERVASIVRDLKVFSRVDARPQRVDVRAAVEAALHLAQNEIRHRAHVTRDLLSVQVVWGEEGRIGQLFLNLLVNAAQAIAEGDAEKNEIHVATRTGTEGWVEIEVSDTGAGIAPDVLPRIFEPFFTTKSDGAGTGLGLSICRSIVADLGGRIEAESTLGKGTTMRVRLPPATHQAAVTPAPPRTELPSPRKRASVLVVDDEPLIVKVVAHILGVEHDVTCEASGGAALARFQRGERFDVVLCDIMMPQVTGIDLYDALLELAPLQAQAMIFLTGGAFTARAQAFLERVPNATIEKPFNQDTLVTRVRQMCRSQSD